MLPSVRSRAAVRRFFLAMALVTRCRAREHGPPLASPPIKARNDSVADGSSPIRWGRRLHDASDFTCADISSTISHDYKFVYGATAANGDAIFAPRNADCVGVFNPTNNAFTCASISSTISHDSKFGGAATAAGSTAIPTKAANTANDLNIGNHAT